MMLAWVFIGSVAIYGFVVAPWSDRRRAARKAAEEARLMDRVVAAFSVWGGDVHDIGLIDVVASAASEAGFEEPSRFIIRRRWTFPLRGQPSLAELSTEYPTAAAAVVRALQMAGLEDAVREELGYHDGPAVCRDGRHVADCDCAVVEHGYHDGPPVEGCPLCEHSRGEAADHGRG